MTFVFIRFPRPNGESNKSSRLLGNSVDLTFRHRLVTKLATKPQILNSNSDIHAAYTIRQNHPVATLPCLLRQRVKNLSFMKRNSHPHLGRHGYDETQSNSSAFSDHIQIRSMKEFSLAETLSFDLLNSEVFFLKAEAEKNKSEICIIEFSIYNGTPCSVHSVLILLLAPSKRPILKIAGLTMCGIHQLT